MLTIQAVALPLKQRTPRRLVVVDLENVVGGAVLDVTASASAWSRIDAAVALRMGDHVVIGVSHISAIAAWRMRQNARVVVRSGVDGADRALLDVLDRESIETRFAEVVLVSGDGIFTDTVARLGACGVTVTVACPPRKLARRLRMAASAYLPVLDAIDAAEMRSAA